MKARQHLEQSVGEEQTREIVGEIHVRAVAITVVAPTGFEPVPLKERNERKESCILPRQREDGHAQSNDRSRGL